MEELETSFDSQKWGDPNYRPKRMTQLLSFSHGRGMMGSSIDFCAPTSGPKGADCQLTKRSPFWSIALHENDEG